MNDHLYTWPVNEDWAPSRPYFYSDMYQTQEEMRITALVAAYIPPAAPVLVVEPVITLPLGLAASVDQKSLKAALALVGGVLPRRSTLAALDCFHIAVWRDSVKVTATNLDMILTVSVPATVGGSGSVLIHGKTLKGIVDKLSSGPVPFNEYTDTLRVDVAGLPLARTDVGEYPNLVQPILPVATVAVADLLPAIERACTMASDDNSRPQLNGVLLRFSGSELIIVSSDGFRLYVETLANVPAEKQDLIIPLATVKILIKALKYQKSGDVAITKAKDEWKRVAFTVGAVSLSTSLVEGIFPNYEMIIPKSFTTTVTLPTKATISALGVLAALKPDAEISRLWAGEVVKVGAVPGEVSNGQGEMVAMAIKDANTLGPDTQIALNLPYFKDALAACGAVAVVGLSSPGSPALFKPGNDDNVLVVIMPMHIGSR